jgi:hypothetical protein
MCNVSGENMTNDPHLQHRIAVNRMTEGCILPVPDAGLVLAERAHVWPVVGKDLDHLYTEKGRDLKKATLIKHATEIPPACAHKMSYFYGKKDARGNIMYAIMWFAEPIPYGSSRFTYGMVYRPEHAVPVKLSYYGEKTVWTH